jgi:23S rRNA-/tRNA-specific pseudouridylate synthase
LAWVGLPIVGDNLYNSYEVQNPASEKKIEFVASSIEFTNPITNKRVVFEL